MLVFVEYVPVLGWLRDSRSGEVLYGTVGLQPGRAIEARDAADAMRQLRGPFCLSPIVAPAERPLDAARNGVLQ